MQVGQGVYIKYDLFANTLRLKRLVKGDSYFKVNKTTSSDTQRPSGLINFN